MGLEYLSCGICRFVLAWEKELRIIKENKRWKKEKIPIVP